MGLSNDVISQFAKMTKSQNEDKKESVVYGTTLNYDGKICVMIDGSDTITPVVSTAEIKAGQRVTVLIKDHTATITGNISDPSASTSSVGKVLDDYDVIIAKVGNFETVIADKVTTKQLDAELAIIENLIAGKASIEELNAINAKIENLDVDNLNAELAKINQAIINKADITDLDAVHAEIDILEADVGNIQTLIGGQLTMDNIQSLVLTSSKVTVDNAFVKDAMIDRVSASKLTAGSINTNIVNISSEDGSMTINGSLQQFKDTEGNVRIQIGKDATGDFTFALYGADGQGQLINQNGITASAISDGLIVNDMVADNAAIAGSKLDIHSVVEEINNGTTTIKSSTIYFDDKNQTLDVAFNEMNTKIENAGGVDTETLEQIITNTTDISVMQGEIETLISNTTITKENGQVIQLKDDYSATVQTVNSYSTKIGSLETNYNTLDSEIESVSSKQSEFEQTLSGFSTRVGDVESQNGDIISKQSEIEQTVNGYSSRITQVETIASEAETKVTSLETTFDQRIDGIDLKVAKKTDKDSIISAINMSTESIKISSSKVNITGFVTFSDLSGSGTTTINGANIKSGYISGDRINGGIINAVEEIRFKENDSDSAYARIFGNKGENGAGIKMSASSYSFGGASVSMLGGSWYVIDGGDFEVEEGDITASGTVQGSTVKSTGSVNASKSITAGEHLSCNGTLWAGTASITNGISASSASITNGISGGSLTISGTANAKKLIVNSSMALRNESIWTNQGTAFRDHLRLSNGMLAYDSNTSKLFVIKTTGDFMGIRVLSIDAENDIGCRNVYATNKVYANGVALSSDASLKTDIRYLSDTTQAISEETGFMAPNVKITTADMHEFVETLPMVSYRMKNDVANNEDYTYYGFVAQDILETKVGSELIEYGSIVEREDEYDEEGRPLKIENKRDILRYSESKFIAFIAGALQEEIKRRKELEIIVNNLINKGEN